MNPVEKDITKTPQHKENGAKRVKRDPLDLLLASQHAKNVHRQDPRHTKVLSPYPTAIVMLGFSTLSLPLITPRQRRPQIRHRASLVMQERTKTILPMLRDTKSHVMSRFHKHLIGNGGHCRGIQHISVHMSARIHLPPLRKRRPYLLICTALYLVCSRKFQATYGYASMFSVSNWHI